MTTNEVSRSGGILYNLEFVAAHRAEHGQETEA